ncbi:MAG: translocation/assembly module TamB domain-containing protein [Pseudomonadota bacterium]
MKRWRVAGFFLVPVLIVLAALASLGLTERGLRQLAKAVVQVSGGGLVIEHVQGRLLGSWQLDGLQVRTAAADLLCKRIVMQWQPLALFHGTVRIVKLHGEGVDVRIKEEGMTSGTSSVVLPDILLPLGVVLTTFELEDVFIHGISGMELPRVEKVSLELAAEKDRVTLKKFEAGIQGISVQAQGNLVLGAKWPLDLQGGGSLEEKNSKLFAADFVIHGDLLDHLTARIDIQTPVQNRVNLVCSDLFGEVSWQLDTTLAQVKLMELNPDWPELVLASVDVKASGTADSYQGTVQLEGAWAQFPQAEVRTEFSGNFAELQVSSLVARLAEGISSSVPGIRDTGPSMVGGMITAKGTIGWQDGLRWQVELEGQDVDPNPYFPDWEGRISTRINTSGRFQADDFSSETQLVALAGDLLGYPLAGSGSVTVNDKGLQVKDLLLRSGESELTVSGTVGATSRDGAGTISAMDLQVQFDSANLGNLLPEAEGEVHLQGSVQGSRKAPKFSFDLNGSKLAYQENVFQALTGSGQGTFSPQGELAVKLAGEGMQTGAGVLTSLTAELGGTVASHQLQARLTGAAGDMEVVLAGGLADWSWQGEVRNLLLQLDPYGKWQLQSPVSLRMDGEGVVDLASVCLGQGEVSLCLQGGRQPSGAWRLDADLDSFAFHLLYQWHLVSRPVEGRLDAVVRTAGVGTGLVKGEAHFSVPELQMSVEDEDGREQFLRWTDNLLTLELVDSKLVSMAKSRFQDGSVMNATITVGQISDLSSSWEDLPIQGEVGLDMKNLAPVAALLNYAVKPTGSMKGTFAVQGLLGNPRLLGELRQTQGDVFIPATGITLEDLLLSVMVKGEGEGMHLLLDATSGPGKIRIAGDILRDAQGGWLVDAIASGKEFEVAHLPEYEILIDPDLHFMVREGVMQLNGKVFVPRASIAITEVDSSVTSSRDIVVVDDGQEDESTDLPLKASVSVELGPDVAVDAFGLKGRLQGSVTVNDAPGLPLSGKGSLTVHDGIFVVRDRPLDITRGRFFLLGGPLDNPGIDVLAQKKNKNKTVGVIASGTVNDMELKLFSDPPMAESAILTELLAGRSYSGTGHQMSNTVGAVATGVGFELGGVFVENILAGLEDQFAFNDIYVESGENSSDVSLMIGKELSEDLYISYGYDPFTSSGKFKAGYDLWKGFSVETEVGADTSGADLLWSIEK